MPFSRALEPRLPEGGDLTAAMVGIGMLFAAEPALEPNLEDTLLAASIAGVEGGDLRVLAVLTTWIGVHGPRVNADRLTRIVATEESCRVRAYWCAIAGWQAKDARFKRLRAAYGGPAIDLLPVGNDFQVRRRGEDPRFAGSLLRVPAGTLRDRVGDVLTPEELAARHRGYFWRIVIGPTYRADLWAELERSPEVSVAELARRAYASFGSAWHTKRDYKISGSTRLPSSASASRRPGGRLD